ncbi:MAG: N-6 DNA methylase, partial [Anaerolineae bacterium]|nr:N-6 DNA methylase [Anaerolineae bacterium]
THEGNVRRAFESLLRETAKEAKGWELVTEQTERREANAVRYDGTLRDGNRLPHGWWEAKDSSDDLDNEIRRKKDRGYRFDNIIFEDTRRAVLYQDGLEVVRAEVRDAAKLADLLNRFYSHEIEPFTQFYEAVAYFQEEIPHIAQGLKAKIEGAHHDNKRFQTAYAAFMELCKTALNPNISQAAVDEMLIQHMLTERLIRKVFDVEEFNRRNVIAAEVEGVIDSLASQHFNRSQFLGALDRFYTAIEQAADRLATFSEKQDFINHVYERFFQGYSVKIADTHGIVYTPQPIVDFMCAAVEEVLLNEFGKRLGDEDIYVIDPCTGTGNFAVNLLRRAHERNPRGFEQFYRQQLFANEVMLMPYYIASLNIEHAYYKLTGRYEPFEGVCFVDTLDLAERVDGQMGLTGFLTEKNTARVERQKAAPITVIIGNPPYNVGQLNENDNNKNRKYEVIDKRVKETYAKDSKATNKNALSDAYVKFFRWAADRLQGRDGIVCYVSNNSFVDQIAFDGMRKHLLEDFTEIYHLDLHGNVRQNPKLSGTTHNVFGIQVGVGVTVAVRKTRSVGRSALAILPSPLAPLPQGEGDKGGGNEDGGRDERSEGDVGSGGKMAGRVFYHRVPDYWTAQEKLEYLLYNVIERGRQNSLNTVEWEQLRPDARHTWFVSEHGDEYESFLLMGSKATKAGKTDATEAIFKSYGRGLETTRDNWIYAFSKVDLEANVRKFIETYNSEIDRWRRSKKPKDIDNFVNN